MRRVLLLFLGSLAIAIAAAPGASRAGAEGVKESMKQADRNGDGKIDRGEFHQRMVDVFYQMDANRDGYLVQSELKGVDAVGFESADAVKLGVNIVMYAVSH